MSRQTRQPWMKFFPADWRSDPQLRSCSVAARGLWIEMIALMHAAEPKGFLTLNGARIDANRLATLATVPIKEVTKCLSELEINGVFSKDERGTIFSRRMVRDEERAARDKANGRTGGNPRLKGSDNPSGAGEVKPGVNGGVNPQVNRGDKPHTRARPGLWPLQGGQAPEVSGSGAATGFDDDEPFGSAA